MDAKLWKSPNLNFVELLKYEGLFIGTRAFFKDGRIISDFSYPEIQALVIQSPGFQAWLYENRIHSTERTLREREYVELNEKSILAAYQLVISVFTDYLI